MTIRDATKQMIRTIRLYEINAAFNEEKETPKDKEIANIIEVRPVTFSRLKTGVQNPDIETWAKICREFKKRATKEEFENLINEICA